MTKCGPNTTLPAIAKFSDNLPQRRMTDFINRVNLLKSNQSEIFPGQNTPFASTEFFGKPYDA